MKIFIEREEKDLNLEFKGTAKELMEKLEINSEAFIIVKNGEVVTEDVQVEEDDKVEFLSVVSGG